MNVPAATYPAYICCNLGHAASEEGETMVAYLIAAITEVTDPERFAEYRRGIGANVAAFGGKYVTGRARPEVLEGDWQPLGITVVEFESAARIHEWYESAEYQALLKVREGAAEHG
ncbi:MAG: DUF1330 domain-containing protein [Thermomicrobia bacterium]|nr:DUF1330 domain-containing protein [Thermomicrobia bacterium]